MGKSIGAVARLALMLCVAMSTVHAAPPTPAPDPGPSQPATDWRDLPGVEGPETRSAPQSSSPQAEGPAKATKKRREPEPGPACHGDNTPLV